MNLSVLGKAECWFSFAITINLYSKELKMFYSLIGNTDSMCTDINE